MQKNLVMFIVFVLALVSGTASANQSLLDIWADINVLGFERAFIDGYYEVTDIYGEITLLGDYNENNADHQKAVSHLLRYGREIQMGVFCSNAKQEKIHQTFLQNSENRPEKMQVKLSVWVNSQGKTLVSIVDHKL